MIELAKKAGFTLAAKSELNANPKDTKDHPFGVWTLPPALRSTAEGSDKPEDPNFDHSKYIAIGESDRMTLKFVKGKVGGRRQQGTFSILRAWRNGECP